MGSPSLDDLIHLPPPCLDGKVSVETALRMRRSIRQFKSGALLLGQASQLLWAAQGMTHPRGFRTVPSAGALYPLEIIMVAGNVNDLQPGVYRYSPQGHGLTKVVDGDLRSRLCSAGLGQPMLKSAAAVLVICAVYQRMTSKYGRRGEQYVHMEAGHAGQNIALQCVAMEMGCVMLGAFNDRHVRQVIGAGSTERPLYLIPIGIL